MVNGDALVNLRFVLRCPTPRLSAQADAVSFSTDFSRMPARWSEHTLNLTIRHYDIVWHAAAQYARLCGHAERLTVVDEDDHEPRCTINARLFALGRMPDLMPATAGEQQT